MLQNEAANQLLLAIFRWSADDAAPSLVSRLAGVYNQAAKVFQTFPAIHQISPSTPLKWEPFLHSLTKLTRIPCKTWPVTKRKDSKKEMEICLDFCY